jgi:hypothetical protein
MKNSSILLLILFVSSAASANDSAFGGSGALPIPIPETKIAMLDEKIIIKGVDISKKAMQGSWSYYCQYLFSNLSDKKVSFTMGFPFPVDEGYGDIAVPSGIKVKKGSPLVYGFKVYLDGSIVPSKRQKIGENKDSRLYYKQAYLWPMTFLPKQKINVVHTYETGVSQDVMGYDTVSYVLKTGRLWNGGKIGQAHIEVIPNTPTRLCHEVDNTTSIRPEPSGMTIHGIGKKRKYVWNLAAFTPNTDLSLCLMTAKNYIPYKVVYPLAYNAGELPKALTKLSKQQLRRLRNSIYAQYGKQFKSKELQQYFNKQWWYSKNPDYSDKLLTKEDLKAISTLVKLEKRYTSRQ